MNLTVFVSGNIADHPYATIKAKFEKKASQLKCMGYHVANGPLEALQDPLGKNLKNDIKKMLECDEVHMLPDWQQSKSAQLERDIAIRLGIPVVYH
jgi:hypothetical protein